MHLFGEEQLKDNGFFYIFFEAEELGFLIDWNFTVPHFYNTLLKKA